MLLLDEPLGALDLKLRQQMQIELKALQRQVGITFVYVTHDQEEALGMSDRLAVFNHGRIEQIGTPEAIYEHPATAFVAGFVGASNIIDADERGAPDRAPPGLLAAPGADPALGSTRAPAARAITMPSARSISVQYHGASTRLEVALDGAATPDRRSAERPARRSAAGARQSGPAVLAQRRHPAARRRRVVSVATTELALAGRAPRHTARRRLSTVLYRHGGLLTLLLLAPPLAWLGIVYLGSLAALLVQSFFGFDDFSGQVVYELHACARTASC